MDNTFVDLYGIMEYYLGTDVSDEAKEFPHAVGEVQKHEHHFKTPAVDSEESFREHEHIRREEDNRNDTAKKIAEASREWAKKVLRREDVLVYVYRLLLEYARILDDRRERMGWVEDLKGE
jgi:hypothetical protein